MAAHSSLVVVLLTLCVRSFAAGMQQQARITRRKGETSQADSKVEVDTASLGENFEASVLDDEEDDVADDIHDDADDDAADDVVDDVDDDEHQRLSEKREHHRSLVMEPSGALLRIDQEHQHQLAEKLAMESENGLVEYAHQDRAAFCVMLHNAERYLLENMRAIMDVAAAFKEHRVFYVENDSSDKTRSSLRQLEASHPMLSGVQLNLTKRSCQCCGSGSCTERCGYLAYLRNHVLRLALAWKECTLIIMMDADFISFDSTQFWQMFVHLKTSDADGIFGLSHARGCAVDTIYDIGALRPNFGRWDPSSSEISQNPYEVGMHALALQFLQAQWYFGKVTRVRSGFGGFGFYQPQSIRMHNATYNESCWDNEHLHFNAQLPQLLVDPGFRPTYVGKCFTKVGEEISPFNHLSLLALLAACGLALFVMCILAALQKSTCCDLTLQKRVSKDRLQ